MMRAMGSSASSVGGTKGLEKGAVWASRGCSGYPGLVLIRDLVPFSRHAVGHGTISGDAEWPGPRAEASRMRDTWGLENGPVWASKGLERAPRAGSHWLVLFLSLEGAGGRTDEGPEPL